MKIVQVITPSRVSGAEIYTYQLSKELLKQGHDVIVIVEHDQKMIDYIQKEIQTIPLKIEGKGNLFGYLRLKKIIQTLKPDVIHTHLTTASWFGGFIGKSLNIPVVSTVHAINSKIPYLKANKIIAVSKAVKDDLIRQGARKTQIEVVRNGIMIPKEINEKKEELKQKWNIQERNEVLGVIAHFSQKKGHKYLLKALAKLNRKDVTLVLCGEGILENKLRKLGIKLGIQDQVIFCGYQKEMNKIYPMFDIVILPSISGEGLPLSILEAQSFEIPVIASDISGIGEFITSGDNGYLVPPKNVDKLANNIENLLNKINLKMKMGKIGKEKVMSDFTISKNCDQIIQIYNNLLKNI